LSSADRVDLSRQADTLVGQALDRSSAPVVLIDGPSGAGKSTFADTVVASWPDANVRLVRMDDLYPGWDGLDAASAAVHDDLLDPMRTTGIGRWRRWDWTASQPAEWHEIAAGSPLVVEGCGCLSRRAAPLADLRVWLTADDGVRKRRALTRDAGGFDAHWDGWERQWQRFVRRESPRPLADLVIDTTTTS
jgi:uridine kinase